jgi:hypothetical protein
MFGEFRVRMLIGQAMGGRKFGPLPGYMAIIMKKG